MKELYEYQIDSEFVEHKVIKLKGRCKRCNFRIDGVNKQAKKHEKSERNISRHHLKINLEKESHNHIL